MTLRPLLGRFKKSSTPKPGGDKIGRRNLDTHFVGFRKLGAKFIFNAKSNIYEIVPGDKVPVHFRIEVPKDFEIGGRHHIKLSFSTQTEGESGVFGFGTGIEQNFDVIIGEEIKEKIEINPGLMVLIIIVLIIIIRVFLKRKKAKR